MLTKCGSCSWRGHDRLFKSDVEGGEQQKKTLLDFDMVGGGLEWLRFSLPLWHVCRAR